eukprot:EG_transcript_8523
MFDPVHLASIHVTTLSTSVSGPFGNHPCSECPSLRAGRLSSVGQTLLVQSPLPGFHKPPPLKLTTTRQTPFSCKTAWQPGNNGCRQCTPQRFIPVTGVTGRVVKLCQQTNRHHF